MNFYIEYIFYFDNTYKIKISWRRLSVECDIMIKENRCIICNTQEIIHENHVRNIDGELVRLCPICYHNLE